MEIAVKLSQAINCSSPLVIDSSNYYHVVSLLFLMLDHHVVLLLQVDPLAQGLLLVGQPISD